MYSVVNAHNPGITISNLHPRTHSVFGRRVNLEY
jgi:hypothetical protein